MGPPSSHSRDDQNVPTLGYAAPEVVVLHMFCLEENTCIL